MLLNRKSIKQNGNKFAREPSKKRGVVIVTRSKYKYRIKKKILYRSSHGNPEKSNMKSVRYLPCMMYKLEMGFYCIARS